MLNRRITRTILDTTEKTAQTSTINADTLALNLTTSQNFYVGYHGKFGARYIQVSTANTNASVMSVSYWTGTAWAAVDDLQDGTAVSGKTLAQSGFVSWINKTNWDTNAQTGIDTDLKLYWVKITVSANLSATTAIQSVINLFSDDLLLRSYYPEIVTDPRYLPLHRSDFLEQHELAKNLCVQRLKQRRVIDDESQVIDINSVAVAAVHAVAWVILNPIASDESTRERADRIFELFNSEINHLSLDTDSDADGVVDDADRSSTMRSIEILRR